jgi:hypothetical protein
MDASDIKSRVSLLNPDQLAVAKLLCQHPEYKDSDIADDLPFSESTSRNLRREVIATLKPFTLQESCPYILGVADEETDRSIRRLFGTPPQTPPTEIKDEPRRRSPILLILGGLVGIVVLYWLLDAVLPITVTNEIEVTRIAEVTAPPVRETVLVTSPPELQTVQVTSLATVLVPTVIIETALATVEVPVLVEVTPAPTATPTPIAQSEYIEDFDDLSIDPAFRVVGDPQFAQGRMNAGPNVTISIGDESWKNYSLSFDADTLGSGQFIQMTVRDRGTSKLRFLQNSPYWWTGDWQYMNQSGEFVSLIDSNNPWRSRVEILVEDDRVIHTHTEKTVTIANTYSDSGGITITIGNMWLDNLVITRLD